MLSERNARLMVVDEQHLTTLLVTMTMTDNALLDSPFGVANPVVQSRAEPDPLLMVSTLGSAVRVRGCDF